MTTDSTRYNFWQIKTKHKRSKTNGHTC